MQNKLIIFVLGLLCITMTALPAAAEPVMPPELEQMMNDQTQQVITELPPRLAVDYIANITYNLVRDVQKLPNGNLLLCRVGAWMPGIVEVDQQGNAVWNYYGIQANSAQRLANGNTLIADSGAPGAPYVPRVVELTRDGKKAWEYALPSLAYAPRYAERLANGNTLVVLPFEVREVTPQKKVVWQYGLGKPGKPGDPGYLARPARAHRLANGNTLIVDRGYARNGRVLEVTPGKKVVWQFAAAAAPSAGSQEQKPPGLVEPLDALRLADGSTLVTDKKQDMVFLVDAQGQVLQAKSWAGLYKTAPVTDLWFAEPKEDGNILISGTMVTGRTRVAEIIGDSMKVVWEKSLFQSN
ncbi:MAG: hypothetical protein M1119_11880 [Firmicutes bacterium]|nr:hypothetical protein [Bacillota bacterium]